MEELMRCLTCKEEKPLSEMCRDSSRSNGHRPRCKPCQVRLTQDWQRRTPGQQAKAQRNRRYKVTNEWYTERLAAQGGVCAICGDPPTPERRLVVDHDHACCPVDTNGKSYRCCGRCNRGLLCMRCNLALASAERSPGWGRRAEAYLEAHARVAGQGGGNPRSEQVGGQAQVPRSASS